MPQGIITIRPRRTECVRAHAEQQAIRFAAWGCPEDIVEAFAVAGGRQFEDRSMQRWQTNDIFERAMRVAGRAI